MAMLTMAFPRTSAGGLRLEPQTWIRLPIVRDMLEGSQPEQLPLQVGCRLRCEGRIWQNFVFLLRLTMEKLFLHVDVRRLRWRSQAS